MIASLPALHPETPPEGPSRRPYPRSATSGVLATILCLFCCLGLGCAGGSTGGEKSATNRLHTDGPWIRDAMNRAVMLRGINVGSRSKLPPFLPFDDISHLDQIAAWGLNSIRLVYSWEAVEPERGRYDDDYLGRLRAILDGCAERGLMVILDSHQDLFARSFCGDGFPAWAVHPDHRDETCSGSSPLWPLDYVLSPGVFESFHRFWESPDLREAYISMLAHVADRLGFHPAVVGFDLMNEPYDITYFLFDGRFEREVLLPFFREAGSVLQERVPDALIVYGTTGLFSVGFPTFLEPLGIRNAVFGAHWYDLMTLIFGTSTNVTKLNERLEKIVADATAWGVPVWIGEYGVPTDRTDNIAFLSSQIDSLERSLVGSAIWTYNPTDVEWNDENTSLVSPGGDEKPHVQALVRPYPDRTAGTPIRYAYDRPSRVFQLVMRSDAGASGPTEIVVPPRSYPGGFRVETTDGEWRWDPDRQRILYSASQDDAERTVRLLPAD